MAVSWVLTKTDHLIFPSIQKTASIFPQEYSYVCPVLSLIEISSVIFCPGYSPCSSLKAKDQLGNPFLSLAKD